MTVSSEVALDTKPLAGFLRVCRVAAAGPRAAPAQPGGARLAILAQVAAAVADALGLPATARQVPLLRHLPSHAGITQAGITQAGITQAGATQAGADVIDVAGLVPTEWLVPELLGLVCEVTVPAEDRRSAGAHYTPPHVARRIAQVALARFEPAAAPPIVCDPACGGGAFLVAAGRLLMAAGHDPVRVTSDCLVGIDLDPVAVEVADASLRLLGWGHAGPGSPQVRRGDALGGPDRPGPWGESGSFDVVLGNPPFLSQLASRTVRERGVAEVMRARYGDVARGYADTAYLFTALAQRLTRRGGVFGMVLPESVLAARDATGLRTALLRESTPRWVWRAGEPVFAAGVRVAALVCDQRPPGDSLTIERARGAALLECPPVTVGLARLRGAPTWSWLVSDDVPATGLVAGRVLGDEATATADFRDAYYGLARHVHEAAGQRPVSDERALLTVGLIDPARSLWGRRPTRFAKATFRRPVVSLADVDADPWLSRWARARLVPKLVLATQTRVLEVLVDAQGVVIPSTPAITVTCPPERLWHLAAALSSPVLSAYAARHYAGAALSVGAIKLSAKQVAALPAPREGRDWDTAADRFRAAAEATTGPDWLAALHECAAATCAAYGLDTASAERVTAWWAGRLPPWRAETPAPPTTIVT